MLAMAAAPGCARYEPMPLDRACIESALTVFLDDVKRRPDIVIDLNDGLSPDEAAAVAVAINPSLRAERRRAAVASAQLVQAGILPNPQLSASVDPVVGGNTTDTVTGYGVGLSWEVTSLIGRDARIDAAKAGASSVRLDIAWREWQTAQAARLAVFDLIALREQLAEARTVDERLSENRRTVGDAVSRGLKTIVDLGAAETASHDARAIVLTQQRDVAHQSATLNRTLGLAPTEQVSIQNDARLPARLDIPNATTFTDGIEDRRLDLVALRRGYESQESTLRAAVLAQFPKINIGFQPANDTSNVHTAGFGVTVDLPLFDRNQGNIAIETATRQKLYDEYVDRVFTARADVATAVEDIRAINEEIAEAETAIPSLERLVDAYRQAVDARNADVLSYYAARNDLANKRIELVKLKQLLMQTGIALELASGQFLPALASTRPAQETPR